jgi:hypothetical protein
MPQPFLGFSLQSFPLARIAVTSRPASFPAVIHRRAISDTVMALTRMVSATPARSRGCCASPRDGCRRCLFTSSHPLSNRQPGPWRLASLRLASFTCFEAFFLLRVRSRRDELPRRRRSILSWASSPLECSLSHLGNLQPDRCPGLARASATRRTSSPKSQVRSSCHRDEDDYSSAPKRTASRRSFLLPRPQDHWAYPASMTLGASKYARSRYLLGEPPLMRFSASSSTSRL